MKRFIFTLALSLLLMAGTAFAGSAGWYVKDGENVSYYYDSSPGSNYNFLSNSPANPNPSVGNFAGGTGTGGTGGSVGPITNTNTATGGTGGAVNIGSSNPGINYGTVSTLSPSSSSNATGGNASATGGNAEVINNNNTVNNNKVKTDVRNTVKTDVKNDNKVNNDQNIAPVQSLTVEVPRQPVGIPMTGAPELNFGSGKQRDVTWKIPKFALWGIKNLDVNNDLITEVICFKDGIKFKKMYQTVLAEGKRIAQEGNTSDIRLQVIEIKSQKTWTTGGSLSGGGSGFVNESAIAGGGSIIPTVGRTKADFLYHVIFVRVAK